MALVGSLSGSFGLVGVSGSMEPAVDNAYSLGNSSRKWSAVVSTALSGSLTKLADGTSAFIAGTNITITTGSNGAVTIASTGGGGGSGDSAAQYLVLSATGSLSDERVFTSGTGIGVTDGGAGGNFTVAIDNSVVATLSGSTFSGGIAGTTLSMSGNVTGSNFLVNGTEITATAPTRFNLGNTAATVNIGQTGTGNALNVRGNLDVDGTADIAGTVTLSGNSQNVTHSGTGNLTIASTSGNVLIEGTTFNGNDVSIPGNLTVNGSVVSIETTNLKIKDAVVLIGSGTVSSNTKSAIAFASGSSITDASLIFGPLGGANTLAAARMDVQDGSVAGTSLSFTDLVPVRASKFEVGGVNAYVTSSDGAVVLVSGSAITLDYGGSGNGVQLASNGTVFSRVNWNSGTTTATFTTAAPNANLTVGTSGNGTTTVSGSAINAIYGSTGFGFSRDGTSTLKVLGNPTNPTIQAQQTNANLRVATNGGGSDLLILSGSGLQINNGAPGITVQRDGSAILTVFGVSGSSTTIDNALGVPTANLFGGGAVTALKIASGSSAKTEIGGLVGQTYLYSDVFLGTGNLIGAPGSGANTLSLISSGNVVAKLDVNSDFVGHKFIVQNAAGTSMFTAGEDGNAEVSGSFVVSGSTLSTVSTSFNLLNTTATTINFAGGASTLLTLGNTSGNTWISGSVKMPGSVVLGSNYTQTVEFKSKVTGSIIPDADLTYDLGSPSFRWSNMYTGDLHLRNDRGSWTIIEESDFLSITNNLNGKRYKFVMEEL